jgi:hypothetical protein
VKTFDELSEQFSVPVLLLPENLVFGFEIAVISRCEVTSGEPTNGEPRTANGEQRTLNACVPQQKKAEYENEDDWGTKESPNAER